MFVIRPVLDVGVMWRNLRILPVWQSAAVGGRVRDMTDTKHGDSALLASAHYDLSHGSGSIAEV